MAELHYLSTILASFMNAYDGDGGFSSVSSRKDEISTDLTGIINVLSDAHSGFSSASRDSKVTELCNGIALCKDALDRVKSHVEGDLSSLLTDCHTVRQDFIQPIIDLYNEGKAWKTEWYEDIWDNTIGALVTRWRSGDRQKIDTANRDIDRYNKEGEAMLNAVSSAINSVQFGVIGNMHVGGVLGASVTYSDTYNFSREQWEAENPVQPVYLAWYEEVGCAVVGLVEGVLKVGENIVDAALTVVGSVTSILGLQGVSDSIKGFIERDVSNDIVSNTLGVVVAGSAERYNNSTGRSVGHFVGKTAASIVAYAYGGPILMATIAMGSTSEKSIQNGDSMLAAGGKGLLAGALTVVTCNIASSIGNWAQSAAGTATGLRGVAARTITRVNSLVGRIPGVRRLYNMGVNLRSGTGVVGRIGTSLWNANTSLVHGVKSTLWNRTVRHTSHTNRIFNRPTSNTTSTTTAGTRVQDITYRDGTTVQVRTTATGNTKIIEVQPDGTRIVQEPLASGNVKVTTTPPGGTPNVTYRYKWLYPSNAGVGQDRINETQAILGTIQQEAS